ncbi:DUF3397 domain-containing protein [Paenibacillus sediminis]|uniref:DUF3397 domain-containing protein n=1 Tax=Paenibacillus sediminis TaxID=664909 RepID=A0ABS4GZF5_9BACL|nr:DUF3397 domain-containing protein [Paenibacillus sediminis]MBP1935437.1 hypothetical protein [Paenibacillus sediminis]
MNLLLGSLTFMSTLPFFPFLIVYYGYYFWKRERKSAILLAMDVTTFFLIFSVSALFNHFFDSRFGFYLILLILLIAIGLIGSAQNRLKGKVNGKRLFRAVWRLSFMFMSTSYMIFVVIGIFNYIFEV